MSLLMTVCQEWQCKSTNWDVERRSLQQQIESLRTQNQILASKCDVIAETSSDLRSQLERRREKLEGSEHSVRSQVAQLSTLLERSKDTISSQVGCSLFCSLCPVRDSSNLKAKAYNTCIAPQAAYCSCSGAVYVTDSGQTPYPQSGYMWTMDQFVYTCKP